MENDKTKNAAKQTRRNARLNAIAQELGYSTWAKLSTDAANRRIKLLVEKPQP